MNSSAWRSLAASHDSPGLRWAPAADGFEQLGHALVDGAFRRALAAVQPLLDAAVHGRRV